jgi:uncharacterized protein YydD (DUF2326 family)
MNIRPLMLMIKLLLELEKMSKEEIALFALTLTDYKKFDSVVSEIKMYKRTCIKKESWYRKKNFQKRLCYSVCQ